VDQLAVDFGDTLKCMIIAHDEFGQHLFPQVKETCAKKGSEHVWLDIRGGQAPVYRESFCVRCWYSCELPSYLQWQDCCISPWTSVSSIGWRKEGGVSLLGESLVKRHFEETLFDSYSDYRDKYVEQALKDGTLSESAAVNLKMVVILDCWPVNCSVEIRNYVREMYPWMHLRYIPAGMTGNVQIGDAYFHAPFKKWMRDLCERWYIKECASLAHQLADGKITQQEFDHSLRKLTSQPTLRNKSVEWITECLSHLELDKNEDGNLIQRAWMGESSPYRKCCDKVFRAVLAPTIPILRIQFICISLVFRRWILAS